MTSKFKTGIYIQMAWWWDDEMNPPEFPPPGKCSKPCMLAMYEFLYYMLELK
jgi:hypothetical protein